MDKESGLAGSIGADERKTASDRHPQGDLFECRRTVGVSEGDVAEFDGYQVVTHVTITAPATRATACNGETARTSSRPNCPR